jgi:hypothetical protein
MFNKFIVPVAAAVLAASTTSPLFAQTPISTEQTDAAVRALAQVVDDEFFDAERAHQISQDMISALENGDFAAVTDAGELAAIVTEMLSEEDRHFSVNYVGMREVERVNAAQAGGASGDGHAERDADPFAAMRRQNFGFMGVEILSGNIGYIDLRSFAPIEPSIETATAALQFIANTDAVIFDLRQNGGGAPSMVQFLTSHFLDDSGETVINTFVSRDYDEPQLLMALTDHPAGYRPNTPLVVLTSGSTGSAGEAFPYHLKAMERATIIGESTYGAGNPGDTFLTETGFSIFVSTGSARNPITETNWEGVGVQPHIAVPAADALDTALLRLYGELAETATNPNQARTLNWAAESLASQLNPVTLSASDAARYAGNFGIRRTWVEDGEVLYQRGDANPYTLIALGDNRFKFPDDDRFRLVFQFDSAGALTGMDMLVADGRVLANPVQN